MKGIFFDTGEYLMSDRSMKQDVKFKVKDFNVK